MMKSRYMGQLACSSGRTRFTQIESAKVSTDMVGGRAAAGVVGSSAA
jgi:hypothetical protein